MHGPLNVKLQENTWVADAAEKLSLDSQRFWKDERFAFFAQNSCIPLSHWMNQIGLRETQVLTLYVECCGFKFLLINVLAALGIEGIGKELNC
jgi:hypothetical protein